jgi:hypothetical protein
MKTAVICRFCILKFLHFIEAMGKQILNLTDISRIKAAVKLFVIIVLLESVFSQNILTLRAVKGFN